MKNPWKKVELIVYLNQDETSRIEYKGRVIQTYGYHKRDEIGMCHFVLKPDGNEDKEFFCLLEAIKYIDEVTK